VLNKNKWIEIMKKQINLFKIDEEIIIIVFAPNFKTKQFIQVEGNQLKIIINRQMLEKFMLTKDINPRRV